MLLNAGVIIAVERASRTSVPAVWLEDRNRRVLHRFATIANETAMGDLHLLSYALSRTFFDRDVECRICVEVAGRSHDSVFFGIRPGSFVCLVDHVEDYRLTGWASPLFETPAFEAELLVDGRECGRSAPSRFRKEFMFVSAHGGWLGYALPLPSWALDGQPHRLAVRCGDTRVEYGTWAAHPQFAIERAAPDRLSGWLSDPGLADRPLTLRLSNASGVVATTRTVPRPDESGTTRQAGFAFANVRIEPGQQISVGGDHDPFQLAELSLDTLAARVNTLRGDARRALMSGPHPTTTYPVRLSVRTAIEEARLSTSPTWCYEVAPSVSGSTGMALPAEECDDDSPLPFRTVASPRSVGNVPMEACESLALREPSRACILVPVYKGLADLKACIGSLLPQLAGDRFRLVIINDASPDREVNAFLAELGTKGLPGVSILTNPQNLGFVGSVNRGIGQIEPGEDVVLVNSDTILPRRGLIKLSDACHARPGIASVTPMSNNATILSFPAPLAPNPPLLELPVDALDAAFEAEPASYEIPTGIGFCLYLNRDALSEIGGFSEYWGRGYCEEVEWCLKARDLGWRHVVAADIFVVHEGSVSFGVAERDEILLKNHAELERLFPEYLDELRHFTLQDPLSDVRSRVLLRLLASRFSHLTVHVLHSLGGGTARYVEDLCRLPRDSRHEVCILRPAKNDFGLPIFRLDFRSSKARLDIPVGRFEDFARLVIESGLTLVWHVNARLGFSRSVLETIVATGAPYIVTLHDFQWYCPRVHLVDDTRFYCGEPPAAVCQLCVRHKPIEHDYRDDGDLLLINLDRVLEVHRQFLMGAAAIVAPSRDTAARYRARFGLQNITSTPHPEPDLKLAAPRRGASFPPRSTSQRALRIAVVGSIGDHKGFELIKRVAEIAAERRLRIFIRIIGITLDNEALMSLPNIDITGTYADGELPRHLNAFDPDFVWFTSVWPETYSYVLSEVWEAGYPVVAFDFGAVAERIRHSGSGILIEPSRDAEDVLSALMLAPERLDRAVSKVARPASYASLEDYYRSGWPAGI